jgi:hypothetical protein
MDNDKKVEILLRKLAQCINLANELQINIAWPIKVASRSVIAGHKKQFDAEMSFVLARPARHDSVKKVSQPSDNMQDNRTITQKEWRTFNAYPLDQSSSSPRQKRY